MTRHLCISVTLLDHLFHGKRDGDQPEWPPSPMRLFQALLAGSRAGCRNEQWSLAKAEAFRWLQRRDPPVIVAPEAQPAAAYTLFVPNNDSDKKFHRQDRLTSKVVRPQRIAGGARAAAVGPTLHYLWEIPDGHWPDTRPYAETLCREARHLMALGWGIDQAVADGRILTDGQAAALPGLRWRAWSVHRPGDNCLRVPTPHSLEDLEMVHSSFTKRIHGKRFNPPKKPTKFASVLYLHANIPAPRHYAAFELPDGIAFRQEDAVAVAAMLRSLACQCAIADSHHFPGGSDKYVAGHGPRQPNGRFVEHNWPRFSYLPLPSITGPHPDGMIRRLLIAEPSGGDGSHARWAQRRLGNRVLRDHNGNQRGLLMDLWRRSSPDLLMRYVGESHTWASVTPVVLPGFDDGKRSKAEKLFLQALTHADLPVEAITDFALRKAPFWTCGRHPDGYLRPDYLNSARNRRFAAWHVRIVFREKLAGPLAIGPGRHCGLGLMAHAP
jgi:CRISPR-associated protein Csb2